MKRNIKRERLGVTAIHNLLSAEHSSTAFSVLFVPKGMRWELHMSNMWKLDDKQWTNRLKLLCIKHKVKNLTPVYYHSITQKIKQNEYYLISKF